MKEKLFFGLMIFVYPIAVLGFWTIGSYIFTYGVTELIRNKKSVYFLSLLLGAFFIMPGLLWGIIIPYEKNLGIAISIIGILLGVFIELITRTNFPDKQKKHNKPSPPYKIG